ncbi:MAG: hypothetical protein A2513_08075 [Sulfurimonas sp. RIFOXYD12_FULL_33_39]|nr:MAG: hypothetical protein A3G74_05290 [Sulfurimonas sp. RIFCSPLOWO2_12_FULL_34_6]OHE10261.1 MAG: hypothetical protein A2513_08075 [Sulfurimonas sp. RIFOXYD12_FULL_33_39]OHE14825.1 MAG: hypothetical protein A2530_02405 [Sulfurimonas sp. RIFOXYD2_FULL_34_21]DAB28673.1 MAG TPA: ABC transporter [Sulfurimonas sp. UBA10385]
MQTKIAVVFDDNKDDTSKSELDEFADEFATEEVYDPFSGYNRFMTSFNDDLYEYILKPISKGYKSVLHEEIRESIRNFFHNLYFPMRVVNNVFQGKFHYASLESGRFIINSTIGILGLFDPARTEFGILPHEEDFGQTLGFYGVKSGPHIVLPIFGPSNLRDALSLYPDSFLSPISYSDRDYWALTEDLEWYLTLRLLENINYISLDIDKYDKIKRDAVDLYPYLRNIYEQHRNKKIRE